MTYDKQMLVTFKGYRIMKKIILIIIGFMGLTTLSTYALARDLVVNGRQYNEHRRIAKGVKSGELTHTEAKSLRQEQRALRSEERAYKSDGKLDKAERQDLRQDARSASRDIYNAKHNTVRR